MTPRLSVPYPVTPAEKRVIQENQGVFGHMTLDDARTFDADFEGMACACPGCFNHCPVCFCVHRIIQKDALVGAASIVAGLLRDLAAKKSAEEDSR